MRSPALTDCRTNMQNGYVIYHQNPTLKSLLFFPLPVRSRDEIIPCHFSCDFSPASCTLWFLTSSRFLFSYALAPLSPVMLQHWQLSKV